MLNNHAVYRFLALSMAEKMSSRKAIPIGSKMALMLNPPKGYEIIHDDMIVYIIIYEKVSLLIIPIK